MQYYLYVQKSLLLYTYERRTGEVNIESFYNHQSDARNPLVLSFRSSKTISER